MVNTKNRFLNHFSALTTEVYEHYAGIIPNTAGRQSISAGDLMKKALIARAFVAGSGVEPESALGGHES
jgi:hypothetical protein